MNSSGEALTDGAKDPR